VWNPLRRGGPGIRYLIGRREFLVAGASVALWPLIARAKQGPAATTLPADLLEKSRFVYISPLRSDGSESTCHGEVWYAWLDGAVVINTAPATWKGRALAAGLYRARVWVGDHGRWKKLMGHSEEFRAAPRFDARVDSVKDDEALLERLLEVYARKYPDEIDKWREKMRSGYLDGSRLLLRYTPV
jgi:hypothetical protein